jgi:hypothetical protein
MREWLLKRRFTLIMVGVGIPILSVLWFWDTIRREWPFWLLCYMVVFPAAITIMWGNYSGSAFWSNLLVWQRMLTRCLAVSALWLLLYLGNRNQSDGAPIATVTTATVVLLWGLYLLFGRTVDAVWLRLRRK